MAFPPYDNAYASRILEELTDDYGEMGMRLEERHGE